MISRWLKVQPISLQTRQLSQRAQVNCALLHLKLADHLIAKKEAKRLEREAKLAAKPVKAAVTPNSSEKKQKEAKNSKTDDVYVDNTPKGEKKGRAVISKVVSLISSQICPSPWPPVTTHSL